MSEELSCTQRPFPRTLWRVFGRGIPSLARPLSYGNGIFQTVFRHSPPICISLRCLFRRCRSAVAAAYTVSATFAMQDADAPLLSVPNQSLPFATPPIQPPHTAGAFAVAGFMHRRHLLYTSACPPTLSRRPSRRVLQAQTVCRRIRRGRSCTYPATLQRLWR